MSASRSSRDKDKFDDHRSNRSHVYGKKRRRSRDSDFEEYDPYSRRKDHSYKEPSGGDALADFRAEIVEEEAENHRSRRNAEPTTSDETRRRVRDKRAYHEQEPSRRDPSDSRSYKENRRTRSRYTFQDTSYRNNRDRDRSNSRSRALSPDPETHAARGSRHHRHHRRHFTPDETDHLGTHIRSNRQNDDRHIRSEHFSKRGRQEEKRGRSSLRSSSTHSSHLSSRSSSTYSTDSQPHSHKRRRRDSRSRSRSRGRKDGKSRKHKRSPSRRKDKDRDTRRSESKRSVLTGKKIKLKVKKDKGDNERDAKRQELLKFLNSAYE